MSKSDYNENSIDSKLTQLIVQQENDAEERHQFRVLILTRLENIEKNTSSLDTRVNKLEANFKIYSDSCAACRKEIEPIVEAASVARGTWYSFKNVALGISFILGLVATIFQIMK